MNCFKPVNLPISAVMSLVLLFSVGQVLAVVNVHNMDNMSLTTSQSTQKSAANMNIHAAMGHTKASNTTSDKVTNDCCQVEVTCQCPQAVCSAVSMLFLKTQSTTYHVMKPVAEWQFYDGFHLYKPQSPLYRPPII